ncbi:MAG: RNA 2',3'-cyclic phosphodiesterase [Armatimonadetes bacterium]|nr:RNA 2',3'-cyclic phosphodiesterase [Armatimonadota bacterium]
MKGRAQEGTPRADVGIRAFIALPVPEALHPAIIRVQESLAGAGDVRWIPPENWHLTLKFLGNISEDRLRRLTDLLEKVSNSCSQFVIELGGIGAFPNLRRPQIVWLGVREGGTAIRELAEAAESAGAQVGFPREKRAFHAHTTLGRVHSPRGLEELARRLEQVPDEPLGSWQARDLVLMRSTLLPSGAVYSVLRRFPLADQP